MHAAGSRESTQRNLDHAERTHAAEKHAAETDSRRIERCHAGRSSEMIESRALSKAGMADTPTDVGFL